VRDTDIVAAPMPPGRTAASLAGLTCGQAGWPDGNGAGRERPRCRAVTPGTCEASDTRVARSHVVPGVFFHDLVTKPAKYTGFVTR
jgi:hypothetical protein